MLSLSLTEVEAELLSRALVSAGELERQAAAIQAKASRERSESVRMIARAHGQDPDAWPRVARVSWGSESGCPVLRVEFAEIEEPTS